MIEEILTITERIGVLGVTLILLTVNIYLVIRSRAKSDVLHAEMEAGQAKIKGEGEALAYQLARDTREDYDKLNDKLTAVERERNTLQGEVTTLQRAFDKLERDNTALNASYKARENEIEELKKRVLVLESQLADSQTTINNLLVELKEWKGIGKDEKK